MVQNARYGMFIHYGLYSILVWHEWVMYYERIPSREYVKLINRFRPKKLLMNEWALLAKDTGMRYMVLTTRHHDGFALFDSKASVFNSVKSPAGRDLDCRICGCLHPPRPGCRTVLFGFELERPGIRVRMERKPGRMEKVCGRGSRPAKRTDDQLRRNQVSLLRRMSAA